MSLRQLGQNLPANYLGVEVDHPHGRCLVAGTGEPLSPVTTPLRPIVRTDLTYRPNLASVTCHPGLRDDDGRHFCHQHPRMLQETVLRGLCLLAGYTLFQ